MTAAIVGWAHLPFGKLENETIESMVVKVTREAYQDPTTKDDWSVVDLEPVKALVRAVTLDEMREIKALAGMALLKKSRLSVSPVTTSELAAILSAGKTKLT